MASGKTHRATFCAETVAVRRNLHLELRFSIGMRSPRPSQARFGSLGFVLRVQPEVVPQALADPLARGVPSMSLAEGLFAASEMAPHARSASTWRRFAILTKFNSADNLCLGD